MFMSRTKISKNDQYLLNLENKLVHDKNNFLISKCNKKAFDIIEKWPDWEFRKLIIIGLPGSGKTHLSKIWQKKTKATFLNIKDYKKHSYQNIFKKKYFIIENITSFLKKINHKEKLEVEKYLLHFYNLIEEKKGYVVLTDNLFPKFWNISLPDLRSRILASNCVFIDQPDDKQLSLLLVKLFSDKQILIDKKIVKFILYRSERSFANLQSIVDLIDRESLSSKKKINLNFVKELI